MRSARPSSCTAIITLRTNGERGDQCSFMGDLWAAARRWCTSYVQASIVNCQYRARPLRALSTECMHMDYDPRSEPHNLAHDPGTCLVVPRPIGWITTLSPTGVVNLAPYSFFNIISTKPH